MSSDRVVSNAAFEVDRSDIAIEARGLSKAFPIYAKPHHRLMQMLAPGDKRRWYREFHALKNVDFSVRRGETVGIVGRNGSGKSTLLQIVCGILDPTGGRIEVSGRIAALLELGAGFNPEFTGRENVYLNATVLGLTREQIEDKFDEIVDFADIGEFIDQPVKTYSSGMYVRLAFAVAINVMPEILIVDEALSVGDEGFQRKCFAKIDEIRDAGATVLFVSHSAGTVIELCDRAILIDHGELIRIGAPKDVVADYQRLIYAPADKAKALRERIRAGYLGTAGMDGEAASGTAGDDGVERPQDAEAFADFWDEHLLPKSTVRYESFGAGIEDPHIETPEGRRVNVICHGREYDYVYTARFSRAHAGVRFGMMIKTVVGVEIAGAATSTEQSGGGVVDAGEAVRVRFRFRCALNAGTYFLNAGIVAASPEGERYIERHVDAAMFRVMPVSGSISTALVDLDFSPQLSRAAR